MKKSEPRITIIPPNGREVPFDRRHGDARLRGYQQASGSLADKSATSERRRVRRVPGARVRARRVDLSI